MCKPTGRISLYDMLSKGIEPMTTAVANHNISRQIISMYSDPQRCVYALLVLSLEYVQLWRPSYSMECEPVTNWCPIST
jgi:hypothetical protein